MSELKQAIAKFRESVRREGELCPSPGLQTILRHGRERANLRWALAGAIALMLTAIPVWRHTQERARQAAQERADELLMQRVSANLSRGVPRAMEPLIKVNFTGGDQ